MNGRYIGIIIVLVVVALAGGFWLASTPQVATTPVLNEEASIGENADGNIATSTATSTPTTGEVEAVVTVSGSNFALAPVALTVKKGQKVTIVFKNSGGVHDLKIDEFGVATKRLQSGEEETVTFIADKVGSFEYYCSVGSHRAMGMKGTLTVTE